MHVHLRAEILAEDMGLEEVRSVQTLKCFIMYILHMQIFIRV